MQASSSLSQPTDAANRFRGFAVAVMVAVVTTFLTVACYSPFDAAEAAYVFALPMMVWALFRPSWRAFCITTLLSNWASWFLILIWLRHIHPPFGWLAVGLLSFLVGLFPSAWFTFARWSLPRVMERGTAMRILVMLGMAGFWVVLEWGRSWIFTGFPWLPLSASQWQRPMLTLAAWTGHYGISFVLIMVNLGLLFYGRNMAEQIKRRVNPQPPADPIPETDRPQLTARQRFEFKEDKPKGIFGGIRVAFFARNSISRSASGFFLFSFISQR